LTPLSRERLQPERAPAVAGPTHRGSWS